jgi:hypothetical protein
MMSNGPSAAISMTIRMFYTLPYLFGLDAAFTIPDAFNLIERNVFTPAIVVSCKWWNENAIKSAPLTSVDCRGALPHHNRTPARHTMQLLVVQRIANKGSPTG